MLANPLYKVVNAGVFVIAAAAGDLGHLIEQRQLLREGGGIGERLLGRSDHLGVFFLLRRSSSRRSARSSSASGGADSRPRSSVATALASRWRYSIMELDALRRWTSQGAHKGLDRRQQPLLQRQHDQHRRGLLRLGAWASRASRAWRYSLKQERQRKLGGVIGQAVDLDADHGAFRKRLTDGAQIRLEPPHHHGIAQLGIDRHPPDKALGIEQLEQRGKAVGVAVVRGRRQKQLVLKAGGEVADGAGQLGVDGVLAAAGRGDVVGFIEDEEAAARKTRRASRAAGRHRTHRGPGHGRG